MGERVDELAVLVTGVHVADVRRGRRGTLRFDPRPDARADVPPVSASLPGGAPVTGRRVETYLWGLLPENDEVVAGLRRSHGVDATDPLSILAAIGKDCAGAVQLCRPEEVEAVVRGDGELLPATTSDIEARLAAMRAGTGGSWAMPGEHWSLGGTQDKLALRREGDRWWWAHGSEPTTHIVKPGVRDARSQALVEHVTMRAAALAGLDVARSEFLDFGPERAVVVARFDRTLGTQGALARVHAEDLCQALGVAEKYEELGGPGAGEVARFLADHASSPAEARGNVERFADAVVLNTVLAAPDAHARNYSVLLGRESVRLAPLYDLATALAYDPPHHGARTLAMKVGGVADASQVGDTEWSALARELRVEVERVRSLVRRLAAELCDHVEEALDEIDDDWDGQVADVRARLLPRLGEHLRGVAERVR